MYAFRYFVTILVVLFNFDLRNGRERRISDLVRITDALAGRGFTSSSRSANRCESTLLLMARRITLVTWVSIGSRCYRMFPSTLVSFKGGEMLQLGSDSTEVFRFFEICVAIASFR